MARSRGRPELDHTTRKKRKQTYLRPVDCERLARVADSMGIPESQLIEIILSEELAKRAKKL